MGRRDWLLPLVVLVLLLTPWAPHVGAEASSEGQPARPPSETVHVVERGETLFSIAERYGLTVQALAHANGLADPTKIYVGEHLKIPTGATGSSRQGATSYVIQAGDSLAYIARRHGVSWQSLATFNALLSPGSLRTGQVVLVPVGDSIAEASGRLHHVRAAETLLGVALRYDVPPWHLMEANRPISPNFVYEGRVLVIPGAAETSLAAPFDSIDVEPVPVPQGGTLALAVHTTEPVTLTAEVLDQTIILVEDDGVYRGFAGVHVFTEPGLYALTLRAADGAGSAFEALVDVVVAEDRFGYERIPASPSLLDPAVVAPERELLEALRLTFTHERMWAGEFGAPCSGTISSYFGARRAYNQGPYTSYHAGVDFRGATGTPVVAPAGGSVVLAEALTVRGSALMLDHGWGVLSGYWHLSSIEVAEGQVVERGEVIGRVGNSGLSTGSHLHWEVWVNGTTVNPLQWLDCFYPWPECTPPNQSEDAS